MELEYSLPPRLQQRLADLARRTGRNESEILATAVLWYLKQVNQEQPSRRAAQRPGAPS